MDERLRELLDAAPGRRANTEPRPGAGGDGPVAAVSGWVVIEGPSKAGKTRTAFEAVRAHPVFGDAALLVLDQSATGEDLVAFAAGGREPLVVWLDNLPAYLASGAITPSGVHQILARPGPVVVIATIVTVDYASITDTTKATDALTQRGSTVLKLAEGSGALVHLDPTGADPEETAAARAAYPDEDLSEAGLAEQLAGAPALARQYATDLSARPVHRAACEVVIDWARVGFTRPIPHQVARDLTKARLPLRLQITTSDTDIDDALKDLCQPPAGPAGHTAALTPHPLDDDDQPGGTSEPRGFGYTPFPYLVAVDDGQDNTTPRPIPDSFWDAALHEAHTPADLTRLGYYASQHQQLHVAQTAWRHAADLGEGAAALGLGNLLADPAGSAGPGGCGCGVPGGHHPRSRWGVGGQPRLRLSD